MKKYLIILLLVLSSCYGKKNALVYHQSLQKQYSYEVRVYENQAFTIKSAKVALQQKREKLAKNRKKKRYHNKRSKIQQKTENLNQD